MASEWVGDGLAGVEIYLNAKAQGRKVDTTDFGRGQSTRAPYSKRQRTQADRAKAFASLRPCVKITDTNPS